MKKNIFLFMLRLFLYLSVTMLILAHPGISVSFDRIGIFQWFIIIPLLSLIAFLPEGKPFTDGIKFSLRNRFFFAALSLILLSVWAGGFSLSALPPFFAGLVSFTLTFLLFRNTQVFPNLFLKKAAKLAMLEPFFLSWVCLRLLALSRSGEEIAGQSMALTQFILVWTAVVFLLHCVVVYFCIYPQSTKGAAGETVAFLLTALAIMVLVFFILPPDFIRNTIVENLLPEQMPERIGEDSEKGLPGEADGREGRRTVPRGENGQQPGLRGISEYNWQSITGRGGRGNSQDNRQYLVMVVASDREPVYMGNSFRGKLDAVQGFLVSPEEPLNNLVNQRFFVTWFNNEPDFDIGRGSQEVFSLSTIPQKFVPWRPVSIDPTIQNENSGPLRYIHQVTSNTHIGDPLMLVNVPSRPFSNFEKDMLAPYSDIPLNANDTELFTGWLNNALKSWQETRDDIIRSDSYLWSLFSAGNPAARGSGRENLEPVNEYLEVILAILTGFSDYQYNLSYNDDYSIASLKEFLFNTADGDCVEFSNTLALLGRLAGIPSRVVTGYLAAEGLQTTAHLRGLVTLREQIPVLQEFPFNNLYMVTNLHSHSWTQFYIPGYGWLDFEATSFALPPLGSGDFNTWDVVIPILDENRVFSAVRKFPWQAVLRAAGMMMIIALVCAYVLRYGRELILYLRSRSGGRVGARALYLLLLARLAADGKPIKPASKTAAEYAQLFPKKNLTQRRRTKGSQGTEDAEEFKECDSKDQSDNTSAEHFQNFAALYSQLRWREFGDRAEMENCFESLGQEYYNILKTTRRRGIGWAFVRIISLRGLAYL